MTQDEFKNLSRGDIVQHVRHSEPYIVDANYGHHVTAVKTVDMSNPDEWILRIKATYTI
jgi:hypothetical protein